MDNEIKMQDQKAKSQGNYQTTGMNGGQQDNNYVCNQLPFSSTKVPDNSCARVPKNVHQVNSFFAQLPGNSQARVADNLPQVYNSHVLGSSLAQNSFANHGLNSFSQPYFDPKPSKQYNGSQGTNYLSANGVHNLVAHQTNRFAAWQRPSVIKKIPTESHVHPHRLSPIATCDLSNVAQQQMVSQNPIRVYKFPQMVSQNPMMLKNINGLWKLVPVNTQVKFTRKRKSDGSGDNTQVKRSKDLGYGSDCLYDAGVQTQVQGSFRKQKQLQLQKSLSKYSLSKKGLLGKHTSSSVTIQKTQTSVSRTNYQLLKSLQDIDKIYNANIKNLKVAKLQGERWLDDLVIDAYFELIQKASSKRVCSVSSQEFAGFVEKREKRIETRKYRKSKASFSELDLIFLPIRIITSLGKHWVFLVVSVSEKKIIYYDSIKKKKQFAHGYCDHVKQFLGCSNYISNVAPEIDWQFENACCPQQSDGFSCGVYVCQVAKQISRSEELMINEEYLPTIRKEMVAEISLGGLFI